MVCGRTSGWPNPPDWKPDGWEPKAHTRVLVTNASVSVDTAWKTPQFWFLWVGTVINRLGGFVVSILVDGWELFCERVRLDTTEFMDVVPQAEFLRLAEQGAKLEKGG